MGLQMCMTFKSSMKSHCFRPACDNFYMNAHGSRWGSAKSWYDRRHFCEWSHCYCSTVFPPPPPNSIHPEGEVALTAQLGPRRLLLTLWMFSHWSSIASLFQTQSGGNPLAVAVLFIQSDLCLGVTMEKEKKRKNFVSPLKLSFFFSPDHFSTVCRHWGVICPTLTHSDWSLFFDKSIYCHPPLFLSSHSCSF